jgi:beta-galactosidase GanA
MRRNVLFGAMVLGGLLAGAQLSAQEIPHLDRSQGAAQLIVDGRPFLALGGELGNSSAGTAAQADAILPRMARVHINTILTPVAWDQIEPVENQFDFSVLDHWIEQARVQQVRLVLLWFGSWKNATSGYAPAWVKTNPKRFPRAILPDGRPLEILSTLSNENMQADARAFRAVMRRVKEFDSGRSTVLMVQVENEVGMLGAGRDHSPEADRLFNGPVPEELRQDLAAHPERLSPELARVWRPDGRNWREAFGERSPEVFMAWSYARYIGQVAAAGKEEYPLPMFANAQLPTRFERAGEYPSGGPHPYYLEVWRAAAPGLDFYSPDIYWPDFEYWIERYNEHGNPVFVPEARLDSGPFNAFYAYGEARAFGFAPFAVDSISDTESAPSPLAQSYAALEQLADILPQAQREAKTRGLVLHASSPRSTQTVFLGGYLFTAALARSWPTRTLLQDDGALIVIQTGPDEFLVSGTGLAVAVSKDVDAGDGIAGIAGVEEGFRVEGQWKTTRVLNGDQTNQGRDLILPAHAFGILRVKLYTIPRS